VHELVGITANNGLNFHSNKYCQDVNSSILYRRPISRNKSQHHLNKYKKHQAGSCVKDRLIFATLSSVKRYPDAAHAYSEPG